MMIWCCGCQHDVDARLTTGKEIYPHRRDLYVLPFWICDTCKNYVGCHHKTQQRTKPLGNIPTPELRAARRQIHELIDPLWKNGLFTRAGIYGRLNGALGYTFHSGEIKSIEEADAVRDVIGDILES